VGKTWFTTYRLRLTPARDHNLGQSPLVTTKSGGTKPPSRPGANPRRTGNCPRNGAAKGSWGRKIPSFRGVIMRIRRQFTAEGRSPYEGIAFRAAASEIRNPDGSIVFAQDGIEVPESWSQVACDVLAQKY